MRGFGFGLAFSAVFAFLPVDSRAQDPAALILDVSGPVHPEVGLYDEVPGGTVLDLGKTGRVTISHYAACEEIGILGGKVSIGADKLDIEAGRVESRKKVTCPDTVVVAEADLINMAVTLRGTRKTRTMDDRPEFVLPGDWGRQFDRLAVFSKAGEVVSLPVTEGHIAWPADAQSLNVGQEYVVVLNGPGAQQYAVRLDVTDGPEGLIVLKGQ